MVKFAILSKLTKLYRKWKFLRQEEKI